MYVLVLFSLRMGEHVVFRDTNALLADWRSVDQVLDSELYGQSLGNDWLGKDFLRGKHCNCKFLRFAMNRVTSSGQVVAMLCTHISTEPPTMRPHVHWMLIYAQKRERWRSLPQGNPTAIWMNSVGLWIHPRKSKGEGEGGSKIVRTADGTFDSRHALRIHLKSLLFVAEAWSDSWLWYE